MNTPSIVFYEHNLDDSQLQSLGKSVLNLGNECRALAEENTRLKAEMEALMTNPTSRLLRAEREETAHLNNYIERLEVRNAELVPENARLKAENDNLKKPAVIGGYNISEYIRMANSETLDFDNGDIFAGMTLPERIKYIVESHARLKAEVEGLRKAGDAVALDYAERIEIEAGNPAKTLMKTVPVLRNWNAAKEGKSV